MTFINISTEEDLVINTEDNGVYNITIQTYLGTTIFKDKVTAIDNSIIIKGLEKGKYLISISNNKEFIKRKILLK